MKRALILVALLALVGTGWADVPDPDYCVVNPMDLMASPRMIGIPASTPQSGANMSIHIAAFGGDVIAGAYVEVILSTLCDDLCLCNGVALTGYTNSSGNLTLNGRLGGCCTEISSCIVVAEGVGIRSADYVVSPDYDGAVGNCGVTGADLVYFASFYGDAAGVTCADYNGDGGCSAADFVTFAGSYAKSCTPQP